MSAHEQERHDKLLPVVGVIIACYVVIMTSSYFYWKLFTLEFGCLGLGLR